MEFVKPKRALTGPKSWGAGEGWPGYTLTFIDHLGRLVLMPPLVMYAAASDENQGKYAKRPPRISRGRLLVEDAKKNFFYYQDDLSNGWWIKTNLTPTGGADMGPLFGNGAVAQMTRLDATTTNGIHKIQGGGVNSLPVGTTTVSFVVKRYGTGTGSRYISLNSVAGSVGFDLQLGTKTARTGSPDGSIEPLYNDSFLVSMTYTHASGNAAPSLSLRSTSGAGEQSFAGTNTSGVYAGFAQLESGSLSSYIPGRFSGSSPIQASRPADYLSTNIDLFPVLGSSEAIRPGEIELSWQPEKTYAKADRANIYGYEYKSLIDGNYGNIPYSNPSSWTRVGAENSWDMFDELLGSSTQAQGVLDVALWIEDSTTIAVMGLTGVDTVQVSLSAGPGQSIYWQQTFVTTGKRQIIVSFPEGTALAEVRLTNLLGGTLQVGSLVWGSTQSLGAVRYGARAGIKDYSRKDTNEFGDTVFVQRAYAKTLSCTLEIEKADLAQVQSSLEELRATPALWIGSTDADFSQSLVVYGFYRDFYVSVDYPNKSLCSLELEGLI